MSSSVEEFGDTDKCVIAGVTVCWLALTDVISSAIVGWHWQMCRRRYDSLVTLTVECVSSPLLRFVGDILLFSCDTDAVIRIVTFSVSKPYLFMPFW